jgi:hypothetical protein
MHGITRMGAVLLAVLVFPSVVSAQERSRGLYIDLGFGLGGIHYLGGNTKKIAEDFNRTAEKHFTLDLSMLTIGGALQDNLYLVGTIAGVGDGYVDAQSNQSQITIAQYGIGLRYYPLPSKTHLQLGLDVSSSVMQITYDVKTNNSVMSDDGLSGKFSAGWDFDSTMTGLAAIAGGDVMFNIIEGETSVSYALFLKLVLK